MDESPSTAVWQFDRNHAALDVNGFRIASDLQQSDAGFLSSQPRVDKFWQITTPLDRLHSRPLVEAYVRADDLIASYAATASFPFATQVYWRLLKNTNDAVSIACIVSVQTDLLDTHPVMEVSCELAADEVLTIPIDDLNSEPIPAALPHVPSRHNDPQLVLFRSADNRFTYAEAIDPSDFCGVELSQSDSGAARVTWRLFSHFLEKGVIRRGRLCSMLVPRENDAQIVTGLFRGFLASELPLTA